MSYRSMTWRGFRLPSRVSLSAVSIAVLLTFSACSSVLPDVTVRTTAVEVIRPPERPPIPNPQAIDTAPFDWLVITNDRLPASDIWVYYGITPQNYEILSRNMADILRWIKEAQWRLDYYRGEGQLDGSGKDGSGTVSSD